MEQKRKTNSENPDKSLHQENTGQLAFASGCWLNIFDPTMGEGCVQWPRASYEQQVLA